jgi:hypothetical protein
MMANRQTAEPDTLVSYYVSSGRGEDFVLQIKASWKLTFGAVNPGAPPHGRDLHCLRVWEGEKLRAVFCDVRAFRDLSLPLARKVSSETGSSEWRQDSDGGFERSSKRQIESSWADPDNIEDIPF